MFERLKDKKSVPTIEEFVSHMENTRDLYEEIDAFLLKSIDSQKALKMDAHSQCWTISYHRRKKYICNIIAEKNAFTLVTRLTESDLEKVREQASPYARECMENSPFIGRGWIEYRVLNKDQISDAELFIQTRSDSATAK